MTDEEKAEEYTHNRHCKFCKELRFCNNNKCSKYYDTYRDYLDGLTEGKPKWHDIRKDPNDLPKENVQIVFYVKEYFKSIEKYKNHYCLGVYKKIFFE